MFHGIWETGVKEEMAKHGGDDRVEPDVAPDGAGHQGSQICTFCGPPRS